MSYGEHHCPMCGKELVCDNTASGRYLCPTPPLPDKEGKIHWIYHFLLNFGETYWTEHYFTQTYSISRYSGHETFKLSTSNNAKIITIPAFDFSSEEHLAKRLQAILLFL